MRRDVVVKKSKIIGRGVFAARAFKKGEVILKWNPSPIKKSELGNLSEKDSHYVILIGEKYFLMQSPERYVNNSCNPNTFVDKNTDVAKRNIKKGEEITSDYTKIKGGNDMSFVCKCGSKNCKKIIK